MKKPGSELIFISRINRDGSGVGPIDDHYLQNMQTEVFELKALSLTLKTFIAFNFNVFVVKLK